MGTRRSSMRNTDSLVRTSTPTDKELPSRRPTNSSSTPTPTTLASSPGPSTGALLSESPCQGILLCHHQQIQVPLRQILQDDGCQPHRSRHLVRDEEIHPQVRPLMRYGLLTFVDAVACLQL